MPRISIALAFAGLLPRVPALYFCKELSRYQSLVPASLGAFIWALPLPSTPWQEAQSA